MANNIDVQSLATSSRRTAVASILGVVVVVASLIYSGYTLSNLQSERQKLQSDVDSLSNQNKVLQDSIKAKQALLELTMGLASHRHEIDWGEAKMLAANYATFKLIEDLFRFRNQRVSWKLGGNTPQEGFDSPGFAAFVLSQHRTQPPIELGMRYSLRGHVPVAATPRPGDLIFYDTGYAMFYLRDRQGQPFCIGMTPMGIVALDINFGPRLLGYGRIEYMD